MNNNENSQTIMIIDKVFSVRKLLTMQLKKQKFKVINSNDCRDAFGILLNNNNKIDLIILDILSDKDTGKRFLKKVKNTEKLNSIPVILFSPITARNDVITFMKLGAADFIIKPMNFSAVVMGTIIKKIYKTLGKTPESKKIELKTNAQKIEFDKEAETPSQKARIVLRKAESVLALPFSVMKVIKLCSDPKSSVSHIVKPIEADPATAALIFKRANSVQFASRERITSLKQAVGRIGFKETRNIATTISVYELFDKEEETSGFNKIDFWAHSITTGIIAEALSKILKYESKEDAFLAGLLHDIGKMIFADFLQEDFQKTIDKAFLDKQPLYKIEREIFEMDHSYIGSEISRKWKLPPNITDAIYDSHNYTEIIEKSKTKKLAAIAIISSEIAKALNIGSGGFELLEPEFEELWKKVMTKPVFWKRVIKYVYRNLDEFIKLLNLPEQYFNLNFSEETTGRVALLLPKISPIKDILSVAVTKEGYATEIFENLDKFNEIKDEFSFLIADLSSLDEKKAMEILPKLPASNIVISNHKRIPDGLRLPLEFPALHKKLSKFLKSE